MGTRCRRSVLTALALSACGTSTGSTATTGIVTGTVTQGPTCPVEQPGLQCDPRPVVGKVTLHVGNRLAASAVIDSAGYYMLTAPVGTYSMVIDLDGQQFPVCLPVQVRIVASDKTTQDISCDTGIR